MRKERPNKTLIYIIIILVTASVSILISSFVIYRNSLNAAEEALKLQALGIAASLEPSLQRADIKKDIFRDIITEASWEGIAFMAFYDMNGATLMHSNENLMGRHIDAPSIKKAASEEKPVFGNMTLGTGEEVFLLDYPIHARDAVKVLRLALHPYPAQNIILQARLQAVTISIVVIILWITGIFFIRAVISSNRLAAMIEEKERLAAIGEMAAVLAHEIRNPLGSIKGFAQVLAEKTGRNDELGVIVDEAARLERLTEDLLLYAAPLIVRPEEFNLSGLLHEIAKLPLRQDGEEQAIRVNVSVPADIAMVADREKLKLLLANLVRNSIDAVDDGGSVEIEAVKTGDKIIIIVRDNGCGMDEETMSKAFNSFFTTKAKGTGLGLAIVEKLAKAFGGKVEMKSSPGSGTVVKITLPSAINGKAHE